MVATFDGAKGNGPLLGRPERIPPVTSPSLVGSEEDSTSR